MKSGTVDSITVRGVGGWGTCTVPRIPLSFEDAGVNSGINSDNSGTFHNHKNERQ